MASAFKLEQTEIAKNIRGLQQYLQKSGLDMCYVSSFDTFLNEYVPLQECHRYYFTGFTGSVAEVLVPKQGKVILFVDGRYHQQADLQVDASIVQVEKVLYGTPIMEALLVKLKALAPKTLGFEDERTPLSVKQKLAALTKLQVVNAQELSSTISFTAHTSDKPIYYLDSELCGKSVKEKLETILKPGEALFLASLDSIAWLTNCRGYQLPNQSAFMAKCLALRDRAYLFVDENCRVDKTAESRMELFFIKQNRQKFKEQVQDVLNKGKVEEIQFDPDRINSFDYSVLEANAGGKKLVPRPAGIIPFHSKKNGAELRALQDSFERGNRAILRSLHWIMERGQNSEETTELEFNQRTNDFYRSGGALEQSFKTISAFGANSSIIHYSTPSAEVKLGSDELVLLDSGAYYESGFATDTTRVVLSSGQASQKQKEIYTLVLIGLLRAQNAVFKSGTKGKEIDVLARSALKERGYDYAHGTGHGVGINVHESGYLITPKSEVPLTEGVVGSIEPGVYLAGFGGVRLENVVVVEKHPVLEGMLYFRTFVYIGFDHRLIDQNLMNKEELKWLADYEEECKKRGNELVMA